METTNGVAVSLSGVCFVGSRGPLPLVVMLLAAFHISFRDFARVVLRITIMSRFEIWSLPWRSRSTRRCRSFGAPYVTTRYTSCSLGIFSSHLGLPFCSGL